MTTDDRSLEVIVSEARRLVKLLGEMKSHPEKSPRPLGEATHDNLHQSARSLLIELLKVVDR